MTDSPTARTLFVAWALIGGLGALLWYAATAFAVGPAAGTSQVAVELVDETGSPVAGWVSIDGDQHRTSAEGSVSIAVDQPVFGFASAEGYLDEPLVLSPERGRAVRIAACGRGSRR